MKFLLLGTGNITKGLLKEISKDFQLRNLILGAFLSEDLIHFAKSLFLNLPIKKINTDSREEESLIQSINILQPDYILSVQYPWILSSLIINKLSGNIFNLHNSKLPDYRGHNTLSHEILNNEEFHTSTLHKIYPEVDRGIIIDSKTIKINPDETAYSLWLKSVEESIKILKDFLFLNNNEYKFKKFIRVSNGGSFFSKNSLRKLKQIPSYSDEETVSRISRAFYFPYHEPAYFLINNIKYYVLPNKSKEGYSQFFYKGKDFTI